MFDVVCLGDATADIFVKVHEADLHAQLHPGEIEMCFRYGSKIPVEETGTCLGGNAANVAVGLKALGLKSAFLGILGDDLGGRWIYETLKGKGVDVKSTVMRKGMRSNQSIVITFRKERTILTYHDEALGQLRAIPRARWIYLTSFGHGGNAAYEKVLSYHKKYSGTRIGFNPGTRDVKRGFEYVRSILRVATVVFVNTEEAYRLTNGRKLLADNLKIRREGMKKSLERFYKAGVQVALITDGLGGSYGFDGVRFYFLPVYGRVEEIVERTGAGDAYSSGFLAGFMNGRAIGEAMAWGSLNAYATVKKTGAVNGLLGLKKMKVLIRENSDYRGKEI